MALVYTYLWAWEGGGEVAGYKKLDVLAASYVQVRKKRKVSSVMGWLLSLQLSEPGAGSCCAVSMWTNFSRVRAEKKCRCRVVGDEGEDELHVAFPGGGNERVVGASAFVINLALGFGRAAGATPARHRISKGPEVLNRLSTYRAFLELQYFTVFFFPDFFPVACVRLTG